MLNHQLNRFGSLLAEANGLSKKAAYYSNYISSTLLSLEITTLAITTNRDILLERLLTEAAGANLINHLVVLVLT